MKSAVRSAAAIAGLTALTLLAGCAPQEPAGSELSTLKINTPGYLFAGNWNPVTSTNLNTFFQLRQAAYETFIQLDPATFEWEPLLAESYEISDDQRSMRIELREDVDFTDGTHLDAESAKESFDYAVAGATHFQLREQYAPEVEVLGEHELRITSRGAMGTDFLFWFGIVPIASPTAIETDPAGLEATPVGTGPYVLTEYVPDVSATFERNPDYRDPEAYPFDEVKFFVFDDPVAVSNALKTGQLDAAQTEPQYAADLEASGFALHLGVGPQWVLVWSDPKGQSVPAIADPRVRRAIACAFDRAAILENIEYGFGTLTSQAWGPGSPSYIEGADDTYAYDVDRARELLAEAGYPDGFELAIPDIGQFEKYRPVLAQSLADIGITVTYDTFADGGAYTEAVEAGKYAFTVWGTSDLFLSDPLRRIPQGGIPELNELYKIVDTGTVQEAEEATREIGRLVLDEAYVIAISRTSSIWATVPEITVEQAIVSWPVLLGSFQLAR